MSVVDPITSCEAAGYFGIDPDPYPLPKGTATFQRVLEIGPGSGEGTLQLLRAHPECQVTCLEPSGAARATLAWRLRTTPDGLSCVVVLPYTAEQSVSTLAEIAPFDAVFAHHVVCEIPHARRPRFWTALSKIMGASTVGLIDSHFGPTDNRAIPRRLTGETVLGGSIVRRWFSQEPVDGAQMLVRSEYEISTPDGHVLHREERTVNRDIVPLEDSLAQIEESGLAVELRDDGWLGLRVITTGSNRYFKSGTYVVP